jgi:hypothetical protein
MQPLNQEIVNDHTKDIGHPTSRRLLKISSIHLADDRRRHGLSPRIVAEARSVACWNDSLGDFFEMAEAQGLDHLRLDRRDVLVGLVGTKRRANDSAGSATALGLTHELSDGLPMSCGFGASAPSNLDMKVLNMASGIWPTSP